MMAVVIICAVCLLGLWAVTVFVMHYLLMRVPTREQRKEAQAFFAEWEQKAKEVRAAYERATDPPEGSE